MKEDVLKIRTKDIEAIFTKWWINFEKNPDKFESRKLSNHKKGKKSAAYFLKLFKENILG